MPTFFSIPGDLPRLVVFSERCVSSQAIGTVPGDVSAENLFDHVVEEVAGYEPTDDVSKEGGIASESRPRGVVCRLP